MVKDSSLTSLAHIFIHEEVLCEPHYRDGKGKPHHTHAHHISYNKFSSHESRFYREPNKLYILFHLLSVSCSFLIGFKWVVDHIKVTCNKDVEKRKEIVKIESLMWYFGNRPQLLQHT